MTGNRRFWIVPTPRRTDMILDRDYVAQVWAEAKVREAEGEPLFLPKELEDAAESYQLQAMEHDDREGLVGTYLETLLPEKWDEMDLYRRQEYLRGDDPVKAQGILKRTCVSNMEIWCECYGRRKEDMQPKDSYAISAIMKHFPAWKRAGTKVLPLYDEALADRAVRFIENLKHTKGKWAGTPFWLLPWQERIVRDVFGIVTSEGYRQFRTAYVEIPKKNGKSELAAAIALYLLYADNEPSAEVYGAAADRQQASIIFHTILMGAFGVVCLLS